MLERRKVLSGMAGLGIVSATSVRAQAWPGQPIRIVVPYVPGGSGDALARILADQMAPVLAQRVVVDNKPGGNAIIGMEAVARARPDGYTLLFGSATLATNAAVGLKQPFDPLKDIQPIASLVDIPDLLAVGKDVPARSYAEFAAWVNGQPERIRYACSGFGNEPHLWGELFRTRNKLKMDVVGYKGSADALRDAVAGHVPVIVDVIAPTGNYVRTGRLTGICVACAERSPVCPDVPTVAELGMKDLEAAAFFGLAGPAGMPAAIVERLNRLCRDILAKPELQPKFVEWGFVVTGGTPEAYGARIKFETERWSRVVRENNIKIEG